MIIEGRDDLETQNLELKMILERLGKRSITVPPRDAATPPDNFGLERRLAVADDWHAVTESDIHATVLGLSETAARRPEVTSVPQSDQGPLANPFALERELKQARLRIEILEAGMGDLEYLREQNARLNEEWSQDRGAARELFALQMEHKRLKLDLQLATERLAAQTASLEHLSGIQAELSERNAEKETVEGLRKQVLELGVEIFALRNAHSGTHRVIRGFEGIESDARELALNAFDAAVLSDPLGLPIAATGTLPADSLAAVSGLAARNAEQLQELLPLGPITTMQWVDQSGKTVTCKLFKLSGDEVIMTTVGAGTPSQQALNRALANVLGSIGWTEEGPILDDESRSATG